MRIFSKVLLEKTWSSSASGEIEMRCQMTFDKTLRKIERADNREGKCWPDIDKCERRSWRRFRDDDVRLDLMRVGSDDFRMRLIASHKIRAVSALPLLIYR